MTALTNKIDKWVETDTNGAQNLVNIYSAVLQGTLPEKNIPYLAVIINTCVHILNEKYKDLTADWKSWTVLLIKKLFEEGKLQKEEDIHFIINEFLEYKQNEYQKYCDDIISVNDYERDRGFMYRFFWKKTKKIGS